MYAPASSSPPPSATVRAPSEPLRTLPEPPAARLPSTADEEALLLQIEAARGEADPVHRAGLLTNICLRWADFDPPAAIALALELKLDPLGGALLPNLAQQWASRDFSAARAWAQNMPAGELRDQVYSRLAYELAHENPPEAARLLAGMRPAGPARDEATIMVVHAWALRDPAGARAWVEVMPPGSLRERARVELAAPGG